MFYGLTNGMRDLSLLSHAVSRSISSENRTGEKGGGAMALPDADSPARDLGRGWKASPKERIEAGETRELADIAGPGAIQQIWMTVTGKWRNAILRFYWDGQEQPSVECPAGDFFCCGWNEFSQINGLAVCVNPGSGFNCYWTMPFRRRCRITLENTGDDTISLYYQINYTLTELPEEVAYFHAQFRRVNPLPYQTEYTILDGVRGQGHYAGTYLAWGVNNNGWWGEGEIKFYLDGDGEFPTICGTGTEDYFGGSYNFEDPRNHDRYLSYSTPYTGLQVVRTDNLYNSQRRFGLYRFHVQDPIRFAQDIRVTIQALSWRNDGRFLPLQDDIASVAFWYQTLPTQPFPALPDRDHREII